MIQGGKEGRKGSHNIDDHGKEKALPDAVPVPVQKDRHQEQSDNAKYLGDPEVFLPPVDIIFSNTVKKRLEQIEK